MGVTSITQEFVCSVPPARMFKALILDSHNLVPKLMPQAIKSVDIIHGDDGAGSIKQINFAEGTHFKYMKHKIDTLDTQNFVCKYALIEGSDKIESIAYEVKFETSLDGRCSCKMTSEYHTSGGFSIRKEKSRVARKEQWPCTRLLNRTFWKTPLPMLKESFP